MLQRWIRWQGIFRTITLLLCAEAGTATTVAIAASRPDIDYRVHSVGSIRMTVWNTGKLGTGVTQLPDPCSGQRAPGLQFPAGSGLEYLLDAGLWVGAVKNGDTTVSAAWDAFEGGNEFFASPYPEGEIQERTDRPVLTHDVGTACPDVSFDPDAISDQDFIATYYDTLTDPRYLRVDDWDGRAHKPLGLQITQSSYAWTFSIDQGFIIIDYAIKNITSTALHSVYVGLNVAPRSDHISLWDAGLGWGGNNTGFRETVPSASGEPYEDTVNVAWFADADGNPHGYEFGPLSPTGAFGIRLLRQPGPNAGVSFNWWIPTDEPQHAWGPVKRGSKVVFLDGNLGEPHGDKAKYEMMSNGELDYDQMTTALDHTASGWLPPPQDPALARDLSYQDRPVYLLSTGPANLRPDSTIHVTYAILAAKDFHTDPYNFARRFDMYDPSAYYRHLNFENLDLIAQTAGWVYDVPGLDTDGDGYRGKYRVVKGDTVYYEGDGVPDYKFSPAPPAPELSATTQEGTIFLRWNGYASETAKDPFTLLHDFEGYRVYMSRTGHSDDYELLAQRDRVDWSRYHWRTAAGRWECSEPPFTLDSLKTLYDSISIADYGFPFHPDSFATPTLQKALLVEVFDERDPANLDTDFVYFVPYEANIVPDDHLLQSAAETGQEVTGVIRKLYPDAPKDSVAYRADGREFYPYYEYEFGVTGLQVAEPIFLSVTCFDFGNPAVGLDPMETSPGDNAKDIWPIASVNLVKNEHPKPGVYPNPYRLVDDYNGAGWENPRGYEPDKERARKMTFYNVPDTCTVSIWSLDGDLIRKLDHRADPASSDASVVVWNLITRNTQAIKTGIYLYSIESRFGTDVGKLVIIK